MKVDFLDAHRRHWDDAERLFGVERWANADHLYGVAAECGLKRLMLTFGMLVNAGGDPSDDKDRRHVNGLWARYESYRSGYGASTNYLLPLANPFNNWNVSDRYVHQGGFDQPRAQAHQQGAKLVCEMIARAQLDGLLT